MKLESRAYIWAGIALGGFLFVMLLTIVGVVAGDDAPGFLTPIFLVVFVATAIVSVVAWDARSNLRNERALRARRASQSR